MSDDMVVNPSYGVNRLGNVTKTILVNETGHVILSDVDVERIAQRVVEVWLHRPFIPPVDVLKRSNCF